MTEQQLLLQAKRLLAILQHAEKVTATSLEPAATTASVGSPSTRGSADTTPMDISVSNSGVWRILKRLLDLNRLPANQRHKTHDRRWKRYEKPLPGHQVQIDDCTRLRVLRIYPKNNQLTAIQFLDHVLEKLPFEQIQTDDGAELQSRFHWHVMDRGIRHVYIKPPTPRWPQWTNPLRTTTNSDHRT